MEVEAANFKKYDDERVELYKIIRELESKTKDNKKPYYKKLSTADELVSFLQKANGTSLKSISEVENTESKEPIQKTDSWPMPNQGLIDQLRQEILNVTKEMLNYKYL